MSIPTIDHPTDRPNFTRVELEGKTLYYSYKTLIGFNLYNGSGPVVRVNDWKQTTGKHLNYIDGGDTEAKAARLDSDAFQRAVTAAGL